MVLSMIALVLTALILTYSVVSRYFFRRHRLAGRGLGVHAGRRDLLLHRLRAVASRPYRHRSDGRPAAAPRERGAPVLVDLVSTLFCAFFTWKSWALFHEAWVDGQTTSSTFAPPLWIPYSMMAAGMSLLTLQLLLQTLARLTNKPEQAA
jgi:TRAP-type C4-dicarboxylate transport system permease small subunit